MPQTNDTAYDLSTPATFLSEAEATNTHIYFNLIFFLFFVLTQNGIKKEKISISFYRPISFKNLSFHEQRSQVVTPHSLQMSPTNANM